MASVKFPNWRTGNKPSRNAVALCALYKYQNQTVTKAELTAIMRSFFPDTDDVQQARHLGRQNGFWIESGTRGDSDVKPNEYRLVSVIEPYPGWNGRRSGQNLNFDDLKAEYGNRCATCGSKQGEPQFHNPSVTTSLQEGHMDPRNRSLQGNAIPQCGECNRAYRDWYIFDANGRVKDINPESSRWKKRGLS